TPPRRGSWSTSSGSCGSSGGSGSGRMIRPWWWSGCASPRLAPLAMAPALVCAGCYSGLQYRGDGRIKAGGAEDAHPDEVRLPALDIAQDGRREFSLEGSPPGPFGIALIADCDRMHAFAEHADWQITIETRDSSGNILESMGGEGSDDIAWVLGEDEARDC